MHVNVVCAKCRGSVVLMLGSCFSKQTGSSIREERVDFIDFLKKQGKAGVYYGGGGGKRVRS